MSSFIKNQQLTCVRGDDTTFTFYCTDAAEATFDLTNAQYVTFVAKPSWSGLPTITKTLGNGVLIADAERGIVTVDIAASDTLGILNTRWTFVYTLVVLDGNSKTTTTNAGSLILVPR